MQENILFLDKEEVISLHDNCIQQYGGNDGILNDNLLESAIYSAQSTMGGEYLNDFPFEMAASYFYSICQNHAFRDGNKRTAVASTIAFLIMNDIDIKVNEKELYDLACEVADGKGSKKEIKNFLQK